MNNVDEEIEVTAPYVLGSIHQTKPPCWVISLLGELVKQRSYLYKIPVTLRERSIDYRPQKLFASILLSWSL